MKFCIKCDRPLSGRQRKYCSRKCKNSCSNLRHQSYQAQQARGLSRKSRLVDEFGSRCSACGYAKNLAALEFHHMDPANKLFQLDLRSLSNRSWEFVRAEASKCVPLCSNCHKEIHNPRMEIKERPIVARYSFSRLK